jgi:hypothetical protein
LKVEVGAAFNGIPFGPVVTSVGIDYVPLLEPSFGVTDPASVVQFRTGTGASNAAPILGPVILNEILYNPPGGTNGTEEFIELLNNSSAAVPLYDAAFPSNRWKLGGGLDYAFPAGVSLAAGGHLLVVEFDPVNEPARLAAFRSLYGINTNIPVYGPFNGNLNNDGDEVELYQPDTPQSGAPFVGFVPYVRVDHVHYNDAAPWPAVLADGGGMSLQRTAPDLYGNEPLHWFEGFPTPGVANNPLFVDSDGDGIPDLDETTMGLNPNDPEDGAADGDLDGMTNYEEWVAGTNHEDSNSHLRLTGRASDSHLLLSFDGIAGRSYSVLHRETAGSRGWTKLADVPELPGNQPVLLTNTPPGASTGFYRVVTPALP